jgi:gluconolactonase
VLTWTTGDRLLVTICAGCFLMRPSPPESDSDGILSELFVEPTERWHLRHVPLAWRHPYRYRLDPKSGVATVATTGLVKRPNGLAFSPDESKLYVIESAAEGRSIYVFDVVDGGAKLANGRIFINCEKEETPDGFRVDVDGNLWCGWGMSPALDGVKVFNPAGRAIGFIALPERAANVCFGGRYRNRLFMAASHSIYSLYLNTQGVVGG